MRWIRTREELKELAKEWGLRQDWHEPDEQEVTAKLVNKSFDNAFCDESEAHVVLNCEEETVAVNLALLFAWATGYND